MRNKALYLLLSTVVIMLSACSATKNVPDGDQLFVGLTKIDYQNYEQNAHFAETQEEVEAALATEPNGALLGSSYYRTPFPVSLWIWNAFSPKQGKVARWITKSFGKQPVLMSWVNPTLRASVAQSVLRNHGYFHGRVSHETVAQKDPKTAKIGYHVSPGHLFTLDTIRYVNFPPEADSLIWQATDEALIHPDDPFNTSALDAERSRIATLFRNNGYYYYQSGYASYLADTFAIPGRVQLRFQMADGVPDVAKRKWYIGRININMRKTFMEQLTDSVARRFFTVRFHGRRPPLRPRVIMADMKLRPRQLYSYEKYVESAAKMNAMGLFSMADFNFTPRDTTATCDTLDLTLNCIFDKPYDFYVETNFAGRTIGRVGPELKMGLTRRNAFRGGEKIDVNVHGSYEWQTGGGGSDMNSYEYGVDGSIEFPRIIAPFFGGNRVRRSTQGRRLPPRRRFYSTPLTIAKASSDIVRRPGFYKMHVLSGEWTYRWQSSAQSRHELSPLTVKYQFMNSHTQKFDSVITVNPYLKATMQDYFIPEMRYTYTYSSPKTYVNPISWEVTVAESGNLTSLVMAAAGKKWSEKGKTLFKNAYSQFLKVETDFTKTWRLTANSQLVGHANGGVVWHYGNSTSVPFSEMFYVGGANSIRAFAVRAIGPGRFPGLADRQYSYLMQNGTLKLLANLEYRTRLFGNLHGAAFIDAGNVWNLKDQEMGDEALQNVETKLRPSHLLSDMAVGTGVGLRYDLEFLILRIDWGLGLHVPYDTSKTGFFNIPKFKDAHTLHFAIGYPF